MPKILIDFLDWNNGGSMGIYAPMEVADLNEETAMDAAIELANEGYGYWVHGPAGEIPCEASQERYYIHAGDCVKGVNDYYDCSCDFDGRYDGEIDNGGPEGECQWCDMEEEEAAKRQAANAALNQRPRPPENPQPPQISQPRIF